ncbi:MAG TPA: hypothetical protein VKN36_16845 [Eudoraea sp.]|nr:hypothetical protein [Eudoraea sp.]
MENPKRPKLLFIYNAKSGLGNLLLDGAHKIFSPSTYACSLCDITYGNFRENTKWKKFREQSGLEMTFIYKDVFRKQYASKFGHHFTFPIVLEASGEDLQVLIRTGELNEMRGVSELIHLVSERIKAG